MRYHLYLDSFLKVFRIIEKCLTENLVVPKIIWFSVPWSWCFSQQPLQVRRKQYCKTTFWFTLIRLMPFTDLWPFLSFSVYEGMNRMYFPSSKSITYFSLNCWKCLKSQFWSISKWLFTKIKFRSLEWFRIKLKPKLHFLPT